MCLTMMGICEWFINKLSSVTVTDNWDTFIRVMSKSSEEVFS